jgi:hypothetical protein
MTGAFGRPMLQPIEPHILQQVTGGGGGRVAAHARGGNTEMMLMMLTSMQSAIQAAANKPNPMLKLLPAMIAMKKGDKKGAMMALLGGGDGDKKSA